jgi:hypothetical protein
MRKLRSWSKWDGAGRQEQDVDDADELSYLTASI